VAGSDASDFLGADQAAIFEDLQVLENRRQRHLQRLGQLAYGCRTARQMFDYPPSAGVGECLKHAIEGI
jgi:hypothetical protein